VHVAALYVFPIKSLRSVSVESWPVEARGLRHDRRWMLVDQEGVFMSQRSDPRLALFDVSFTPQGLRVANAGQSVEVPLTSEGPNLEVEVWGVRCQALEVSGEVSDWFSRQLDMPCRLVYMPDDSRRNAGSEESGPDALVGFADSDPILVASQASLDDLNSRLPAPVPMLRFRPNVVLEGVHAFAEDEIPQIELDGLLLRRTKRCGRCLVTTIDIETGERGTEPLRTLSAYRTFGRHACFGSYFVPESEGTIAVGQRAA
jgi:uncharacterized protein